MLHTRVESQELWMAAHVRDQVVLVSCRGDFLPIRLENEQRWQPHLQDCESQRLRSRAADARFRCRDNGVLCFFSLRAAVALRRGGIRLGDFFIDRLSTGEKPRQEAYSAVPKDEQVRISMEWHPESLKTCVFWY
jgi:hypothetical protein